jgi:hypothetical protein
MQLFNVAKDDFYFCRAQHVFELEEVPLDDRVQVSNVVLFSLDDFVDNMQAFLSQNTHQQSPIPKALSATCNDHVSSYPCKLDVFLFGLCVRISILLAPLLGPTLRRALLDSWCERLRMGMGRRRRCRPTSLFLDRHWFQGFRLVARVHAR